MFIAHLPAGYLLTRTLNRALSKTACVPRYLTLLGLVSSVTPDFDLIYSFLVDPGRLHHHRYITHWPLFWSAIFLAWGMLMRLHMVPRRREAFAIVALNIYLHLVLDWMVSAIFLFAPFGDRSFNLFVVPARHHFWYLNFVLYWTFLLDFGIALFGTIVFFLDRPWIAERRPKFAVCPE